MVQKNGRRRAWLLSAVGGIIAVAVWFWIVFHLIFHVSSARLLRPVLLFEILQVIMTLLFYLAWKPYESPSRDLRPIYTVCAAWCTVGLSLLFRDLYLFGIFVPATGIRSIYEVVWIGAPLACLVAYFLAKKIYVDSGQH